MNRKEIRIGSDKRDTRKIEDRGAYDLFNASEWDIICERSS